MEQYQAGEASRTDMVLCYMAGRADAHLVEGLRAVSYTHLDVYKRQGVLCILRDHLQCIAKIRRTCSRI